MVAFMIRTLILSTLFATGLRTADVMPHAATPTQAPVDAKTAT